MGGTIEILKERSEAGHERDLVAGLDAVEALQLGINLRDELLLRVPLQQVADELYCIGEVVSVEV